MTNPVWKKVEKIEPGLYWYGGWGNDPFSNKRIEVVTRQTAFNAKYWYAKIGDLPPDPVIPQPELKEGDPVMVRDSEDHRWLRRHFAGWSISGDIICWVDGCTKWSSEDQSVSWKYWRLPTEEELK